MVDRARLEKDELVLESLNNTYRFPVELLDAIANLEGKWALDDALFFLAVFRKHEEYRWSTPAEEVGNDLTGWGAYVYISNWEDSGWDFLPALKEFRGTGNSNYHPYDVVGESLMKNFDKADRVLLVKLSDDDFTSQKELAEERAAAMDESMSYDSDDDESILDWEKELLKDLPDESDSASEKD